MFYSRVTVTPAMGKGREVRSLVEESTKKRQGQGNAISLATSVFGEVPSLVVTLRYNDMAEYEKNRAKNAVDKDWQEYLGKLGSMATTKVELFEVLLPFPKS